MLKHMRGVEVIYRSIRKGKSVFQVVMYKPMLFELADILILCAAPVPGIGRAIHKPKDELWHTGE
jgi:hypothetical protein